MPPNNDQKASKFIPMIAIVVFVFIGIYAGTSYWLKRRSIQEPEIESVRETDTAEAPPVKPTVSTPAPAPVQPIHKPIKPQPVIDVDALEEDKQLMALMEKRKAKYGIKKGLDIIVKPDESIKVGDSTVPMREILDKIRLKKGDFVEKSLATEQETKSTRGGDRTLPHPPQDLSESPSRKPSRTPVRISRHKIEPSVSKTIDPSEDKTSLPRPMQKQETQKEQEQEYVEPPKAVSLFRKYKQTLKAIDEKEEMLIRAQTRGTEQIRDEAGAHIPKKDEPDNRADPADDYSGKSGETQTVNQTVNQTVKLKDQPAPATAVNLEQIREELKTLARIRENLEKELQLPDDPKARQIAIQKLQKAEDLYLQEKEKKITRKADSSRPDLQEKSVAGKNVPALEQYRHTVKAIDDKKKQLLDGPPETRRRLEEELKELNLQKEKLQRQLEAMALSGKDEKREDVEAYGIYVVKPNDNLWNVHFVLLKEYFNVKGVTLESGADEPDKKGHSSGVGRLLKFSEHMVFIYNVRDRKLSLDLDMIHPTSKIVVFNMGEVFSILDNIDYRLIDRIRFDGDTLWLPAE
jgi:hypothetical protein